MIESTSTEVISSTYDGGRLWFHPRACSVPHRDGTQLVMTGQSISGSDVFGHIHWMTSTDGGRSWNDPQPIPELGRRQRDDGIEEGVCDAVPEYHRPTGTVLLLAFNVYYRDDVLTMPDRGRCVVYSVLDPATGRWSGRKRMPWDEPLASALYTSNCSQRVTLDHRDGERAGDVIVPLTFGPLGRTHRAVCTVRCAFDGAELRVAEQGSHHELPVRRGLLEPSVTRAGDTFFLTVRAEDDRGYVSRSADGLHWEPLRPWCWEDGEPLVMSTTQQRWLPHSDALHLVYTRRTEANRNVFRWRTPLWVAEVDRDRLCLRRDTERVVLPMKGDGVNDPDGVPRMGNFHTTAVSADESIVTVGECLPAAGYQGETLLARVRWSRPNRLFG